MNHTLRILAQILWIFAYTTTSAQYPLRDAIQLAPYFVLQNQFVSLNENLGGKADSLVQRILLQYNARGVADNLFILAEPAPQTRILPDGFSLADIFSKNIAEKSGNDARILSGGYGSPFAAGKVAQGIAIFLANRAKEELSAAFFEQFKQALRDPRHAVLQALFPTTVETLRAVGSDDFYRVSLYISTLRNDFERDINALPESFEDAIRDGFFDKYWQPDTQKWLKVVATDGLHAANILLDAGTPMHLLNYLASEQAVVQDIAWRTTIANADIRNRLQDAAAVFRLTNVLQNALRKSTTDVEWFSAAEVTQALKNPVVLYLFLGLIWEQAEGIIWSDGRSLRGSLEHARQTLSIMTALQREVAQLAEDIQSVDKIRRSLVANAERTIVRGDSSNVEPFFRYFNRSLRLVKTGYRWLKASYPEVQHGDLDNILQQILSMAEGISRLHQNLRVGNYPAAVSSAMGILKSVGVSDDQRSVFFRYANFMASVALCRTSEQMVGAIEAFALPAGSSQVKKVSGQRVFSINGFAGLSSGGEWQANLDAVHPVGAVYAPVGVSYTVGNSKDKYWGVYMPIIDVGALTAVRFSDPRSYDLPTLKWANLVAPGFYWVHGFKRTVPLTLGLGGQFGPGLRKVQPQPLSNPNLLIEQAAWRFGAFLSVDIPVTYLHLSKKKS